MLKNYLKVALRNLLKHKLYATINVVGLAVGMACCLFILLYVQFETSYDNYHKDVDRIFRVPIIKETASRRVEWPVNTAPLAPALTVHFPQVEYAGRLAFQNSILIKYGDQITFEDNVAWGDQEIFDILTIPFLYGNPSTALIRPNSVVLSRDVANAYFGYDNPIGQFITINGIDHEITGIIDNAPANTHVKLTIVVSLIFQEDPWWMSHWPTATCLTYVKLAPGTDVGVFNSLLSNIADSFTDQYQERSEKTTYYLQPIRDIHLHSHLDNELEPPGNTLYLYIFSLTGILILFISCINFINLTTAKHANRSKEVGIRKVVGARRRQLIWQFLGESMIVALFALALAVTAVILLFPIVNSIVGTRLDLSILARPALIILTGGITLLIGIAAGLYPALLLSSLKPAVIIKGIFSALPRGVTIRRLLVVSQFVVSIALIIGSMVVYLQIGFMKAEHPGFDKEQKFVLEFPETPSFSSRYDVAKSTFKEHPSITGATASSTVPGRAYSTNRIYPTGEEVEKGMSVKFMRIDHDFLQDYDIEMVAGRPFQHGMETDRLYGSVIINEAMVKSCGWGSPEEALDHTYYDPPRPIVGVTKDFHIQGFQHSIEPLYMNIWQERFRYLTLTLNTENLAETLDFIEEKHRALFPDLPYEYFFLDTSFENQYRFEDQISRIFSLFTFLGILIACLGIIGLAAYMTEQRTKEVGIRKTFGASEWSIMMMLTTDFLKWLVLGTVLAWPIAYLCMDRWLDTFAYHIDLGWLPFFVATALSLSTALLTISFQIVKAAARNPIDSLRYE